jgi:hypothetical protein
MHKDRKYCRQKKTSWQHENVPQAAESKSFNQRSILGKLGSVTDLDFAQKLIVGISLLAESIPALLASHAVTFTVIVAPLSPHAGIGLADSSLGITILLEALAPLAVIVFHAAVLDWFKDAVAIVVAHVHGAGIMVVTRDAHGRHFLNENLFVDTAPAIINNKDDSENRIILQIGLARIKVIAVVAGVLREFHGNARSRSETSIFDQ